MPHFGKQSRIKRNECEPALQRVLNQAINSYDFSVICGFRGMAAQNEAERTGNSHLRFPASKHNSFPSKAFDVVPYPDKFDASEEEFYLLATHILAAASEQGVPLRWGGHWTTLHDLAHFELIDELTD